MFENYFANLCVIYYLFIIILEGKRGAIEATVHCDKPHYGSRPQKYNILFHFYALGHLFRIAQS